MMGSDAFKSLAFVRRNEYREDRKPSLVEQSDVRRRVRYLVHCLVEETSLEDEICQEALLHFWKRERVSPGRPMNYYLRSCLFRIQDLLKAGRSVHCPRHRAVLSIIDETFENISAGAVQSLGGAEETLQQVSARDAFGQLLRLLQPLEKKILVLLSQGNHTCEIARRLEISHSTVIKHRGRIAVAAVSIGFSPGADLKLQIRIAHQ